MQFLLQASLEPLYTASLPCSSRSLRSSLQTGKLITLSLLTACSLLINIPHSRAITTPYKLPWFNVIHSWRILFTPTERRRPWIIYLTPGLLTAQVAHISFVVIVLRSVRQLLLPTFFSETGIPNFGGVSSIRVALYFALAVASTIVLAPLEVIAVRLAIQRNHAAPEYNSVSQEEVGDAEETAQYAGTNEDVIGWVSTSRC